MSDRLLTARDVAGMLGFSAGTIVDWAEAGKVPGFKVGGRLRFRESEVLEWLEGRRLNGPGTRGVVSPAPSGPARRLVSQPSPAPQGGKHAS